ncbi:hypothetical protein [Nocardia sp. NPDC060249]|uniref:hypothetical protein n=1 Tax=Nocardia sp. NPDC060249 TaxID=3347082 RepID=UPI0036579DB1
MNTHTIAATLGISPLGITGHHGVIATNCLDCDLPATVYIEATATLLRGSITEDGHYCREHAVELIAVLDARDEEFAIDVYAPEPVAPTALAA